MPAHTVTTPFGAQGRASDARAPRNKTLTMSVQEARRLYRIVAGANVNQGIAPSADPVEVALEELLF